MPIVAFRKNALLPLEEGLLPSKATIPHLTHLSAHAVIEQPGSWRHYVTANHCTALREVRQRSVKVHLLHGFSIDFSVPLTP